MTERISKDQFYNFTRPHIGLPVSMPWRGYGTAIFLEIGELREEPLRRRNGSVVVGKDGATVFRHKGEFGIMIEWSWRVERPQSILFGSFNSKQIITRRLEKMKDLTVVDVTVEGRIPELVVQLSNGHWVHSFATTGGQPQWCLFLRQDREVERWITSERGKLVLTTDTP